MKVVIIKYNAGNVQSVLFALQRIGVEGILSDDPELIRSADKVIFPGVGEASSAMKYVKEKGLDKLIPSLKQPLLGICLGMQLMCTHSEEGNTNTMGIFPTKVKLFKGEEKIPHVGWNNIATLCGPLFKGLQENEHMYFVHSYYAECCEETTAKTEYILPFSASLRKNNFYAVQFHPEKSGIAGQQLLKNFVDL